jgi:ABC-type Fe3+/spermidine/putrescine transport system ATPase subunit
VSLARALVVQPQVLLLDEPFSALDASLRVEVRELVADLQREAGVTTLFVTHDQEEATVLADRVALMLDGRLEQLGTPRELYESPASLAVARFFGTANAFDGVVSGGRWRGPLGEVPVTAADGPGTLVVRQEAVRVVGPSADGVDAVVTRTSYAGTAVRAWADVAAPRSRSSSTRPPAWPPATGCGCTSRRSTAPSCAGEPAPRRPALGGVRRGPRRPARPAARRGSR